MTYQANQSEDVSLKMVRTLHQRIIKLREKRISFQLYYDPDLAKECYNAGHRDARQAAAELVAALPPQAKAEPADWLPTAENVNALPEPLRRYVADLETLCDPAGIVRENTLLKDCNRGLQAMYRKAAGAKAEPAGVSEREAFEDFFGRSLDFSHTNTWSGIEYVHPHVESIWYGWQARAILSAAPSTGVREGAPGATDAERAAWLADKISAHGDYAKEAAQMLRRWPDGVDGPSAPRLLTHAEVMAIIDAAPPPSMPNTFAAIQAKFCEVNGLPIPSGVGGPSAPVAEYKPCPDCSGSGIVDNTEHFEDCKPCNGTGNVGVDGPLKEQP